MNTVTSAARDGDNHVLDDEEESGCQAQGTCP